MSVARVRGGPAAALLALAACGGAGSASDSVPSDRSGGESAAPAAASPTGAAPSAACPHDGRWRPCSVVERLEQAGLAPRVDSAGPAPRAPFLSAPATHVLVGRAALHAFVYDDTARLARDVAAMDTVRVAPRGGTFAWDVPPTLVRSANLLAVLLVPNERQNERVRLALEAGPPQRNPDRR